MAAACYCSRYDILLFVQDREQVKITPIAVSVCTIIGTGGTARGFTHDITSK